MVGAYQDDRYFEGEGLGYSSYLAQEATLRRTFRRLMRTLERRGMTGGGLLEVGCAYGFFLDEAEGRFDLRVGTEYSPAAAERARERCDRVVLGGLDELGELDLSGGPGGSDGPGSGAPFRLAACIHVIEHVYDPVAFVRQLHDQLEPGGWLVVATPDMGGFWRPLLGRRWPFYKMPEHVTYFDRSSLSRLLEAGGFRDVRPIPYASYFAFDLVAEKLGLPLPGALSRLWMRLPATTVALVGRRPPL
jgi:SAM-dependent methyltransferase